ncbi:PKD domain-containing protein, partial [Candidatus Bipolaricaulota bacterium]|nr:PKD domain-containing protein [Candidatus Bipolaricaulota bacterium]
GVEGGWRGEAIGRATLSGAVTWQDGEFGIEADRGLTGGVAWSSWLHWEAAARIGRIDPEANADASVALTADLQGRLSGPERWLLFDATASLLLEPFTVDVGVFQTVPAGASLERIGVTVGLSQWRWEALLTLRDLSPVRGEILFDGGFTPHREDLAVSGSICVFPAIRGQVGLTAGLPWGSIRFGAVWGVDDPLQLSFSVADAALGVDIAAAWIETRGAEDPMQLEVEAGKDFRWGKLRGRVVLGGGVRLEMGVTIKLDALKANRPPVAAFTVFGLQSDDPLTLWLDAASSQDPDGGRLTYEWSFGDGGENASGVVVAHAFPAAGSYSVGLTVTDEEGSASRISEVLEVGGLAGTETTARFSWNAEDGTGRRREGTTRIGDMLVVDAGESISEDRIVEFAWDVGGDGVVELRTENPVSRLPLLNEGPVAVVLRVTDAGGRTGVVSDVVDVVPRAAPIATAAFSPVSPLVGEPVAFTDISTDPDGVIIAWSWSFGDGQRSDEQHPRHAYAVVGAYEATLEVTDHEGLTDRTNFVIEVVSSSDATIPANVWVLAIGISDYATVNDLQYAREDAVAIARWALSEGVPLDHLRLLLDEQGRVDDVGGLSSGPADLLHVREALGWLRREAGENDLVIVSFSGHGARAEDDNGDESDGWDELFVLRDTIVGAEAETALRDDELAGFVGRIPSQRVVLLLDTCFSGGAEAGGRTVSDRQGADGERPATEEGEHRDWDELASSSTVILAAAGEGQIARESEALGHGVFTYFFLEAVQGGADADGDERVTAAEAARYIAPRVDAFVFSWLGVHQQPQLTGRGDAAIVLARTP